MELSPRLVGISVSEEDVAGLRRHIRPAVVSLTVYAVGGAALYVLYLDYLLLHPYLYPLLWALLCSIPLHHLKSGVISLLEMTWEERWEQLVGSVVHVAQHVVGRSPDQHAAAPHMGALFAAWALWLASELCSSIGWGVTAMAACTSAAVVCPAVFLWRRLLPSARVALPARRSPARARRRRAASTGESGYLDCCLAAMLVVLSIGVAAGLVVGAAYRVGVEGKELAEASQALVVRSLPPHLATSDHVRVVIERGSLVVERWGVTALEQAFPGLNASDIAHIAHSLRCLLPMQRNCTAGQLNASNPGAAVVAKGIREHLPQTERFVVTLLHGQLFELPSLFSLVWGEWRQVAHNHSTVASITTPIAAFTLDSGLLLGRAIGTLSVAAASLCLSGFIVVMQFMLFCSALYYLLYPRRSLIESVGQTVSGVLGTTRLSDAISETIRAVFLSSIKLFVYHALFTGLVFKAFGIRLVLICSLISGFFGMVPVVSPLVVCILALPQLIAQGRTLVLVSVFVLHLYAWWFVDTAIMAEIPGAHPLLAGMSVALGVSAFNVQGIILGPTLVCLPVVIHKYYVAFTKENDAIEA
eukprot:m51a1_g5497 hypothetical protein (586) ;mRNA; r:346889-348890